MKISFLIKNLQCRCKFTIVFLLNTSLLFSIISVHATAANKQFSSVDDFIAEQKIIRISMDVTPGFGNQASSMNVMNYLRMRGFTGTFEVIYARSEKDKITTLFDLSPTIPDDYFDSAHNIRYLQVGKYIARLKNHQLKNVTLGMNGGEFAGEDLFNCYSAEVRETHIDFDNPICHNQAKFANVEMFADVNPFIGRQSYLSFYNQENSIALPESKTKFFVMPVSDLKQAKHYLEEDPKGPILLQQKLALKSLIEGIENNKFNLFPLYGYSLIHGNQNKNGGYFPSNILQILAGARYAQIKGSAFLNRPLIIPIFYNYEKEALILKNLLHRDYWGEYEKPGVEIERKVIKRLGLADALQFASISDVDAFRKIEMLQPGQMLLLSMGFLPKTVFDGIYTAHARNVWPQIREGATSFNSLILTGRAHFRCTDYYMQDHPSWEIGYDRIQNLALKQRFIKFYNEFCAADDAIWLKHENTYQQLGQFIIESLDNYSALSQYFKTLKSEALKPKNDKINYILEEMLKAIHSVSAESLKKHL